MKKRHLYDLFSLDLVCFFCPTLELRSIQRDDLRWQAFPTLNDVRFEFKSTPVELGRKVLIACQFFLNRTELRFWKTAQSILFSDFFRFFIGTIESFFHDSKELCILRTESVNQIFWIKSFESDPLNELELNFSNSTFWTD